MELLAPAGDLEAGYAAFHYGADAIYLGLKRFSARAEAANFTPEELSEIVGFAHAATPRRSVFVALNTLVMDDELNEAIETLALLDEIGVDGVIVQDLGLARLVRAYFPRLNLHASTQMAIHNVAGALTARKLGFSRVTLARELTLTEITAIARESGLEVETFIHGALCYCLYSSLLRGRSGNRGRCTYPCRDTFEGHNGGGYPFSMKDLALTSDVVKLRDAGVFSFKIEGRKKSPLYVAAATHYYRGLLDNRFSPHAKREAEEDIKTIFSRPWTGLYLKTARNRGVTDAEVVGHRGALIGVVQEIIKQGRMDWIRFKTQRRLERHDGIQTDVPGQGRPFGFPVDRLRLAGSRGRPTEEVFEAPAHEMVEVGLPEDHPDIEVGAPLYCSSSQEVKQRYRFPKPKPGLYRVRTPVSVVIAVGPGKIVAQAGVATGPLATAAEVDGTFESGREPAKIEATARQAFEKLGDTPFELAKFRVDNPDSLFIPVSLLNRLRREVMASLAGRMAEARQKRVQDIQQSESVDSGITRTQSGEKSRWSLKVDRVDALAALDPDDLADVEEVVVEIQRNTLPELIAGLTQLERLAGKDRIRLALPILTRDWEWPQLEGKIKALKDAGWRRWEAGSLSAWTMVEGTWVSGGDMTADWAVYVTNRSAARQLQAMGASRFTLSPEMDREGLRSLLGPFGNTSTVIVYQDSPLFISENCALAASARKCPANAGCRGAERDWTSGSGEKILLVQQDCRTWALNTVPFSLAKRVDELHEMGARHLRADFIIRHYGPDEVRRLWHSIRQGKAVPGYEGNFTRGLK